MLRKLEFRYTTARKGQTSKSGTSDDAYKMHVVITTPETCMAADSKTATGRMRRELSSIQVIFTPTLPLSYPYPTLSLPLPFYYYLLARMYIHSLTTVHSTSSCTPPKSYHINTPFSISFRLSVRFICLHYSGIFW